MKSTLQFLLKGTAMITFLALALLSCNQEELKSNDLDNVQTADLKKGKIDICHYSEDDGTWFVVSVNEKGWEDHSLHGDVRLDDQDGDGLIPYNECGIVGEGIDCNDFDPVNISGKFCGNIDSINANGQYLGAAILRVEFDENSCNPIAKYNSTCYDITPATWTLLGTSENTYTYLESDSCGISGCIITIVNKGSELEISYDCPPPFDTATITGIIEPSVDEIPYNGIDDDCNSATPDDDLDGDGFNLAEDCDDTNPALYPGAPGLPVISNLEIDQEPTCNADGTYQVLVKMKITEYYSLSYPFPKLYFNGVEQVLLYASLVQVGPLNDLYLYTQKTTITGDVNVRVQIGCSSIQANNLFVGPSCSSSARTTAESSKYISSEKPEYTITTSEDGKEVKATLKTN